MSRADRLLDEKYAGDCVPDEVGRENITCDLNISGVDYAHLLVEFRDYLL